MRLTTVILIAMLMQVSAAGLAQKITLSKANTSLQAILKELKAQSGYNFIVTDDQLAKARPVSIKANNQQLENVLDQIFAKQQLGYAINNNTVVIVDKTPSFLDKLIDRFAAIDVRGRVLDAETGNPLAGASVKVSGTNKATLTNDKGEFFLSDVKEDVTIEISFVGYVTKEFKAKKGLIEIRMTMAMSDLDQVQVIGYGTTTKRLSVENVGRVSSKTIDNQPVTNFINTLAGRIPGVSISQNNGYAGAFSTVVIRGRTSLGTSNSNDPLYIVDGVPYASSFSNIYGGNVRGANEYLNPLNSLSPADIESIEVLKDATATAIYGSRAANGVILITTKTGKTDQTGLDFQLSTGFGRVANKLDLLNTQEYLALRREAFANDNVTPTAVNAPDLTVWDQNHYTDWQKELVGSTARNYNAQLALSGGHNNLNYRVSGNYQTEGTVFPGDFGYKRAGLHTSINHTSANNRFSLAFTSSYNSDVNKINTFNSIESIILAPNLPIYDQNGNFDFSTGNNPIAEFKHRSKSETENLIANAKLSYKILDNLTFSSSLGFNRHSIDQLKAFLNSALAPVYQSGFSSATFGDFSSKTYIAEPQLNYVKQVGKGDLNVLAGATYQYTRNEGTEIQGLNYTNEALIESIGAAGSVGSKLYNFAEYKYASVFARLNYVLNKKYIINGSFRRDGSSRFGPNNKYGNFGAGGIGWIFSEESLVKSVLPFLSYGKFRASYGTVGNDRITDYSYISTYSPNNNYQNIPALVPSIAGNPNYQWESTRKTDVALDLGFFKDRLLLNAAWYKTLSSNQLIILNLPGQTGTQSFTGNSPATVRNSGWEFELNTKNLQGPNLKWTSTFNFTMARNKLVSFPNLSTSGYAIQYEIGKPIIVQKRLKFQQIDPQTGIPVFAEINGDNIIGSFPGDYIAVGSKDPAFFGALGNNFSYKGFELDVFFQFVKQKGYELAFTPGIMKNQFQDVGARWRQAGDTGNISRASATAGTPAYTAINTSLQVSDYYFKDASYIRLKNIALSYTLPRALLDRLKLKQCRFFVQGQNLLTFTNYRGLDPETNGSSPSNIVMPPLRVLQFGFQFNL